MYNPQLFNSKFAHLPTNQSDFIIYDNLGLVMIDNWLSLASHYSDQSHWNVIAVGLKCCQSLQAPWTQTRLLGRILLPGGSFQSNQTTKEGVLEFAKSTR